MKTSQEQSNDYSAGSGYPLSPGGPDDRHERPLVSAIVPLECGGWRLDAALALMYSDHSRSRLQTWLKADQILVDGMAGHEAKRRVIGGERISFAADFAATVGGLSSAVMTQEAEDLPLGIVFEDDALIVINKPAGLVVHPGNGNASGTLMNALLHHAPRLAEVPRAGIVHRLDKDTSGLLVVAKTLTAQTDLVRQLQARTVKRHYLALVMGAVLRDGTVDAAVGRHPVQRTKMAVVRSGGREARTHYAVRERFAKVTLLECRLETGRTHQIRVHMASIAHCLVGDPAYGKARSGHPRLDAFKRQALHAWRLALVHPVTKAEMAWEAPLPEDFAVLLDDLRA